MAASSKSTARQLTNATIIIAFLSLAAKVVGLARNAVFAAQFGAGSSLDVYYAAFRVPDFLYNLLILGTLSAAFIPIFTQFLVKDEKRAWKIANSIFNATLLVMAALSAVLAVFASDLVRVIVPGFSPEKQAQTAVLTRWMLLSPLFFSLSSVFSSILNSFKKFTVVAAVPLLYNLSIIFGAIFLYPRYGMTGLAFGVVLGAFLHLLAQVPAVLRTGFRWWPEIDWKDSGFRTVARLFVPRIFSMDAGQIGLLITSVVGSALPAGTISEYNLASDLQAVPLGVIAVAFAVAAFPYLSEASARGDRQNFREVFNGAMSQILFVVIPLSALLIIMRAQIVRLAYGRGHFGWEDTIATLTAVGVFSLSLFAQSLVPLLARAFYALHNTVIPVIAGLVSIAVNIAGALYFTQYFAPSVKVAGLALAFSVAALVNFLILFVWLEFKFGNLIDWELLYKLEKICIATFICGVVAYFVRVQIVPFINDRTVIGVFIQTAVASAAGLGAYLLSGYVLKLGEARHIWIWGRQWLNKIRTAFVRQPGSL